MAASRLVLTPRETGQSVRSSLLTREGGVDTSYVARIKQLAEFDTFALRTRRDSQGIAAPRFVTAAKTALRVALWTCLTGAGVLFLRHADVLPDIYITYLNGVVIAIIFNVTTNVATTIQSVVQSLVGTAFAILVGLILYNLPDPHRGDPAGAASLPPTCPASADDVYHWFCVEGRPLVEWSSFIPAMSSVMAFATFALFVAVTLALNVVQPFKTFALVAALNFMMNFANPAVDTKNYMELKWDSVLVVTVVCQLSGSSIAILAMLLPPVTATSRATSLAARSTKTTAELLLQITTYYCGSDKTLKINVYNSQLDRNREDMANELKDLENGWWEYFDWGRFGVARLLMKDHIEMLKDLDTRLSVMQEAVLVEGFEATHREVMVTMRKPMLEVVKTTSECLLNCTLCSSDGWISEDEASALKRQKEAIDEAIGNMATDWRKVRGTVATALSAEMRAESFFLLELSTFGRIVGEFAGKLENPRRPKNHALAAILNVISREKLSKASFRNFVLRNWISLMLAWLFASIVYDYTTLIPLNVVFMLTQQPGNSLLQNLQRLQASVLGSLAGTVLYRTFHFCGNWSRILKLISLFVWELLSMFIANYTREYAIVGLLLAVYGGGKLMMVCDEETSNGEVVILNSTEFRNLRFFADAMLIVSVVDFLLTPAPAADQARDKLLEAIDRSFDYFEKYFKGECPVGEQLVVDETTKVTEEVESLLDQVEALLPSADQEPRFDKGRFRTTLYSDICGRMRKLQLLSQVLLRRSEGAEKGLWSELNKCSSFKAVEEDMLKTIEDTKLIVKGVVSYDGFGAMDPNIFDHVIGKSGHDQVEDLHRLEKEVVDLPIHGEDDDKFSLEFGAISRFAAVFELLEIYVEDLAEIMAVAVKSM